MEYTIEGLSEPQSDKNGEVHVRIYTPTQWSMVDGNPVMDSKTIFCYDETMFDQLKVGQTVTVK
tara:strand:+ start:245 stop:436 length:192 start_codon:yes stop_codon:yes gene_type:complete